MGSGTVLRFCTYCCPYEGDSADDQPKDEIVESDCCDDEQDDGGNQNGEYAIPENTNALEKGSICLFVQFDFGLAKQKKSLRVTFFLLVVAN